MAGESVLIVEDEAMIALMIEEQIEVLGLGLFASASTVAEALMALDGGGAPDVALLDCRLGEDRSWAIARRLREQGVPLAFMTGAPDDLFPDDLADLPRLGKPFTLNSLGEILQTALDGAQTH